MRDGPEVQSHLVGHQCVSVVKQVDVTPSQWAVLLKRTDKTGRLKDVPAFMEEAHGRKKIPDMVGAHFSNTLSAKILCKTNISG